MKLAKYLWTIASFYLLVIGFFYMIVLKDSPPNGPERYEFIIQNWATYNYQWKAELMMATLLSISSFLFSKYLKNPGFIIIGVGQLFFAMAMPLSIGITPNASYEFGSVIGKGAHQMVNFGMMVSLAGYYMLHWKSRVLSNWLRISALTLTTLAFLSFLAGFLNIIEASTAQKAMLFVMFLYVINGYFGIKVNEQNARNV
ncbi:hypothetical protein [Lentiprolixibacter aurantiacus]|uniref:DUF998 domain-containing protein n=1 Tax=Lentiprolixibacter aurantiacus TaxID=2993939 RepID=A0AAE3SNN4_9FLAO|nr:hypothetical protein [Lentiprolixibacter aurantiacus]MCX2718652.1 hypothetical protein [Lentiprolixibacter aurantiacus]